MDSNEQQKVLFEAAFNGTFHINPQTMRITNVSPAFQQLIGCSLKDQCLLNYIPKDQQYHIKQLFSKMTHTGLPIKSYRQYIYIPRTDIDSTTRAHVADSSSKEKDSEFSFVHESIDAIEYDHKKYKLFVLEMTAVITRMLHEIAYDSLVCVRDVTRIEKDEFKQKQLHLLINNRDKQQRTLLEIAFDGTCIIELDTYTIIHTSQTFERILGYNSIGEQLPVIESMKPSLKRKLKMIHDLCIRWWPSVNSLDTPIKGFRVSLQVGSKKNHQILLVELYAVHIPQQNNAIICIRDIQDVIEMEERERELRKKAELANKKKRDFVVSFNPILEWK